MEEKYKAYHQYNFTTSEKWQAYLNNIYPMPKYSEMEAFKKKWYKKNIDADIDLSYIEPTTPTPPSSSPLPPRPNRKKAVIWQYQCVLYSLYIALTFSPYTFRWWHAVPYMLSLIMELFNKYGGPRCNKDWWTYCLTDEFTQYLMYGAISSYMCQITFATKIPNIIYAFMFIMSSFRFVIKKKKDGLIAKMFSGIIAKIDNNWANLEEFIATYEIYVGVYLILCFYPLKLISFFAPIGYWYMMQFRYMLSFQAKAAFMKLGLQLDYIKNHRLCPKPIGWLITGIKYVAGFFSRMAGQQQAQPSSAGSSCIIF